MKNKIAVLIPQLYWGGMPRVASNLVGNLIQSYDIDFIVVNSTMEIREETYEATIHRVQGSKLSKFLNIRSLLHKNDYKAVISFGIVDNFLNILLTPNRTKTIITEHSTKSFDNKIEKGLFRKFFYSLGIKYLYNRADHVVAVSQGISEDLKKQFGVKKIDVIYNIVSLSANSSQLIQEDEELIQRIWNKGGTVLVNAGRITEPKGQMNLIKSMKYLNDLYHLVLIGEGDMTSTISDFVADNGLTDRVHIIGYRRNIRPWLEVADLYVSMSWFEGFPTVLLEAIQSGTPVVSSDIFSGPREILSDGEILDYSVELSYPYRTTNGIISSRFNAFNEQDFKNMEKYEKDFANAIMYAKDQKFNVQVNFVNEKSIVQQYIYLIEE